MARPTYVNIPDTDVDLDSPGKTVSVFENLRDNINAARVQIIPTDIAEQSETSTGFVTQATVRIFIPNVADYAGIARRLVAELSVAVTSGHTGTFRIQEQLSLDVSNEVTTVSVYPTFEYKIPIISIDAAWLSGDGVSRDFDIQAKTSAGTAYVKADQRATWYMDY